MNWNELITGILLSIVMIPETIAYSYLLGVDPNVGIQSAMVMGFITSLFGTPALISGATASVATSLIGVSQSYGNELIPLTVIVGGMLQIILGCTGAYKMLLHLSPEVNSGFLVALALMIGSSQIESFKDASGNLLQGQNMHHMLLFVLMGLFIIQYGYLVIRNFDNKAVRIPGSVLEIVLISLFLHIFPMSIPKINHKTNTTLPVLNLTGLMKTTSFENIGKIFPYALAMAVAGLIESLIMVKKINEDQHLHNSYLKETLVQGFANIVSGLTGGMGGCVLVGESLLNLSYGSTTRLSSITTTLSFFLLNLCLNPVINQISMSSIVAIMIYISYLTGDWASLNLRGSKLATVLITTLGGFASNSLTLGVLLGTAVETILK